MGATHLFHTPARLVGGRFDGQMVTVASTTLLVPFSLGTQREPGDDRLWLDEDGMPLGDPVPIATYELARDPSSGDVVYRFASETTAEHWTQETYEAEMLKRLELRRANRAARGRA